MQGFKLEFYTQHKQPKFIYPQKITQYKKILEQDEEVLSLVKKINNEKNIELKIKLRKKLYSNNNYKNYMDSYNELNYIVLKINNKFKEYTNTKECISKE